MGRVRWWGVQRKEIDKKKGVGGAIFKGMLEKTEGVKGKWNRADKTQRWRHLAREVILT